MGVNNWNGWCSGMCTHGNEQRHCCCYGYGWRQRILRNLWGAHSRVSGPERVLLHYFMILIYFEERGIWRPCVAYPLADIEVVYFKHRHRVSVHAKLSDLLFDLHCILFIVKLVFSPMCLIFSHYIK